MKNLKATVLASLLVISTGFMFSQTRQDINPEGTWTFTAPEAPVDYSTGDFVITLEGGELKGELVFSEYYKIPVEDLKTAIRKQKWVRSISLPSEKASISLPSGRAIL